MRLLILLALCVAAYGAPAETDYLKIIYRGSHDIVKIDFPANMINGLSTSDDSVDQHEPERGITLFFVEADIKNGKKTCKGVHTLINGTATTLLDEGTDVTSAADGTKNAYFATKRGIYVYDYDKNEAKPYGTITDSLVGIANENGTGVLYVIDENKKVYKVTSEGKEQSDTGITDADEILVDYANNLFYVANKQIYVHKDGKNVKIQGLPETARNVFLTKRFILLSDGVIGMMDDKAYTILPDGTSEDDTNVELGGSPTALTVHFPFMNYYSYDKNIYEVNFVLKAFHDLKKKLGS